MKKEVLDLTEERKIITNMIMSTEFMRAISTVVKAKFFVSTYARQVASWVMEYWNEYKESPGKNIQDIYIHKSKQIVDEEDTDTISDFLTGLSKDADEFKIHNLEYAISNTIRFLKIRSLNGLKEDLADYLLQGDPIKAEAAVAKYSRVESLSGEAISLFKDPAPIMKAFMDEDEVLFSFPGALGEVSGAFLRGDLSAWLGFTKRGKSWWLGYTAEVAAFHGLKVLYATLEMPKNQLIRRLWQGLEGLPKNDQEIMIPSFERCEEETKWRVVTRKEKRFAVNPALIGERQQKLKLLTRRGDIRVESFPAFSATVEDIINHIDTLQYFEDYIPDVIIIDYADIIKPSFNGEYRHQIDSIWKKLRGLAQERNVAVVTASQSGRGSAGRDASEEDVAEDIRKLAHVSKMLSINRKKEESKRGIVRIIQLAERDGSTSFDQAVVLQCLSIGKVYLDSRLKSDVDFDF